MWWYILSIVLMSYASAELSRLIFEYRQIKADPTLLVELVLMWVTFIAGMVILAWRIRR